VDDAPPRTGSPLDNALGGPPPIPSPTCPRPST